MKRNTVVFLCILLLVMLLSSCTKEAVLTEDSDGFSIVVTNFPEYDWVREILGDRGSQIHLTMLQGNGVDSHSYQPTVDDIVTISTCDLFIYVGGESDSWVDDVLSGATNKEMIVVNLMEILGDTLKEEEVTEGMEHHDGDFAGEYEGVEYDEHVFLSLKNAQIFCGAIAKEIGRMDSEYKEVYLSNAASYIKSLTMLDEAYREAIEKAHGHTLLFGDRFPFRYLMDDYALSYYAAFPGCSAETEAGFETIVFLARKVDELKLPAIMQTESSDGSVAETIRKNTTAKNQKILTMDSMQSTTIADVNNGITYRLVMENNLEALKEALS